eukprot:365805-Chlamydomonas_euryale.AAC.4
MRVWDEWGAAIGVDICGTSGKQQQEGKGVGCAGKGEKNGVRRAGKGVGRVGSSSMSAKSVGRVGSSRSRRPAYKIKPPWRRPLNRERARHSNRTTPKAYHTQTVLHPNVQHPNVQHPNVQHPDNPMPARRNAPVEGPDRVRHGLPNSDALEGCMPLVDTGCEELEDAVGGKPPRHPLAQQAAKDPEDAVGGRLMKRPLEQQGWGETEVWA